MKGFRLTHGMQVGVRPHPFSSLNTDTSVLVAFYLACTVTLNLASIMERLKMSRFDFLILRQSQTLWCVLCCINFSIAAQAHAPVL